MRTILAPTMREPMVACSRKCREGVGDERDGPIGPIICAWLDGEFISNSLGLEWLRSGFRAAGLGILGDSGVAHGVFRESTEDWLSTNF